MFKASGICALSLTLILCACAIQNQSNISENPDTIALYKSCDKIVAKAQNGGQLCRATMRAASDSAYTGILAGLYAASQKTNLSRDAADYGRELERFFKCKKGQRIFLTESAGKKDISSLAIAYVAWINQDIQRLNMPIEETIRMSLFICPETTP